MKNTAEMEVGLSRRILLK